MDWAQAGLTLGAVVVGALASITGTVWIQRRLLRKAERVVQYRDLVPALMDAVDGLLFESVDPAVAPRTEGLTRKVREVARHAVIAGDGDAVMAVVEAAVAVDHADPYAGLLADAELYPDKEQTDALQALRDRLREYDSFLCQKLA